MKISNVTQDFTLVNGGSGSVRLSGIDGTVHGFDEYNKIRNRDLK